MNAKEKVGCLMGLVQVAVVSPIWYYLLYKILVAINANELMFFLFWVYVPVAIILNIFAAIAKSIFDEAA